MWTRRNLGRWLSAVALSLTLLSVAGTARADEDEDSERKRRFYLEASAGYNWVHIEAINQDNFLPAGTASADHGAAVGGGFGFFVGAFTLGGQMEWAMHSNFDLGTVALDIGFRIPSPHVEPYFRIGGGYAWMANVAVSGLELGNVHGGLIDVGAGFDFQINDLVAIGAGADFAFFLMRRGGIIGGIDTGNIDTTLDGTAVGYQISVLGSVSLHF